MTDPPAPLILIADDHVDNVDLLEQRLERAGYRTATAYDGVGIEMRRASR